MLNLPSLSPPRRSDPEPPHRPALSDLWWLRRRRRWSQSLPQTLSCTLLPVFTPPLKLWAQLLNSGAPVKTLGAASELRRQAPVRDGVWVRPNSPHLDPPSMLEDLASAPLGDEARRGDQIGSCISVKASRPSHSVLAALRIRWPEGRLWDWHLPLATSMGTSRGLMLATIGCWYLSGYIG